MPAIGPGGQTPNQIRSSQIAYYATYLAKLPGKYQGNYKQYDGLNWTELYKKIAASNPKADPKQLADAVLGVEAAQRLGTNTQAAGNGLGKFVVSTEKAAASTNFAAGVPIPANPLDALSAFFSQITKLSMWRSLGWIVLGGTITGAGIYWWAQTEGEQGIRTLAQGKKPRLSAPVLPLILMIIGLYLMWFGIKYWEDTETIWPSDPVKAILQGKGLPARSEDSSASAILGSVATQSANQSQGASGSGSTKVPAGSLMSQAKNLMTGHHWGLDQLPALVSLWNQESGWNPKARNSSSGAYGIAQALGHGVAGGAASDGMNEYGGYGLSTAQAKAANSGSGYWQMVWGLNYIAATYGSPQAAWSHEQTHNWY